jgi:group I intron endonuclease
MQCSKSKIGIYKITSPSGRIYIGQSINIDKRWRDYFQMNTKTKSQIKLWRSFTKYGITNHTFEILEKCTIKDNLNKKERFWQDYFRVIENGLNCILQDSENKKRVFSKETIEKIRKSSTGRKVSKIQIDATRKRMLGNTYNTGRKRKSWEKNKISKSMKLISQGKDNNMYGKLGENNPNSKIILNTELGIFYFGIKEAAFSLNIPHNSMKKYMCGNRLNKTPFIYI